jgi:hypothetical protein
MYPLSAIVETDWLPFTFTMNWVFTRYGTAVRFEKGEPFCHIFPIKRGELEKAAPRIMPLTQDAETEAQYRAWTASRTRFNDSLAKGDDAAIKQGWQKHYYKGEDALNQTPQADGHRTRLRVQSFRRL